MIFIFPFFISRHTEIYKTIIEVKEKVYYFDAENIMKCLKIALSISTPQRSLLIIIPPLVYSLSNVHLLRDTDDIYIVIKAKDINM